MYNVKNNQRVRRRRKMKQLSLLAAIFALFVSGCVVAVRPYSPYYSPPVVVIPPSPPVVGMPHWIPGHYETRCYVQPGGRQYCPRTWVPGHWE